MQEWWNGRHAVFRRQCEQSRESSNLFSCTMISTKALYISAFFVYIRYLMNESITLIRHTSTVRLIVPLSRGYHNLTNIYIEIKAGESEYLLRILIERHCVYRNQHTSSFNHTDKRLNEFIIGIAGSQFFYILSFNQNGTDSFIY